MEVVKGVGAGLYRATTLDPEVTVKDVVAHPLKGQLSVLMSIKNANAFPMEVTRVSYKVTKKSDGDILAEGTNSKAFAIPRQASEDIEVPVHFSWGGIKSAGSSLVNRGETDLLVVGEVTVHSSVAGDILIPYQGETIVTWD
jgi:LEA14-like dessication related protein